MRWDGIFRWREHIAKRIFIYIIGKQERERAVDGPDIKIREILLKNI